MDIYIERLKKTYPNLNISISHETFYDKDKELTFESYTMWVQGKVFKRFMDKNSKNAFRNMVEAILYLTPEHEITAW